MLIVIFTEHQNSWLKNLEDQVMEGTDGKSGASGCALIGTSCNPMGGIGCEEQFDKYGKTFVGKNSYWTFQAVKGMHGKFAELHRQLTTETLVNGLKIGQMLKDFSGNENGGGNMKGWLSAAATMGNALGGLVPGVVCYSVSSPDLSFALLTITNTGLWYFCRYGYLGRYHVRSLPR